MGRLVSLNGTITRTGQIKLLETTRLYTCQKCKSKLESTYNYEDALIPIPVCCGRVKESESDFRNACIDYQEIKVQEQLGKSQMGTIPRLMNVLMENELVDLCKAGDDVTIT